MITNDIKEQYINFDEYIRQGEPAQRERAEAFNCRGLCKTALSRQASPSAPEISVDGQGIGTI
jgi:hypothetical protein